MWYPPPTPQRRVEAVEGVTGPDGRVTFTWADPFPAPPVIGLSVHGTGGLDTPRVVENTAEQTVVEVRRTSGVNVELLGLTLLGADQPAAGVTVQVTAQEPTT